MSQQVNHSHNENAKTFLYVFPQSTIFNWDKVQDV